jgi:hypothetical protein
MREAIMLLQEELLQTRIENSLLKKLKEKDQEVLQKISEELKNLRRRIFASQQERKANKPKNHKKRKKTNLPHNRSQNNKLEDFEIDLNEEVVEHKVDESTCPNCGGDKFFEMKNC